VRLRVDSSQRIAALVYCNAVVSIWDLEKVEKIGKFEKEGYEGVYSSPPALDITGRLIPPIPPLYGCSGRRIGTVKADAREHCA
jgi:hypothetical protein